MNDRENDELVDALKYLEARANMGPDTGPRCARCGNIKSIHGKKISPSEGVLIDSHVFVEPEPA